MLACLVLAAGLGTRLRPLTDALPKALVPIGDRSALAHAVDSLRLAGAEKIAVNAHHHADAIARAASPLGIETSREEKLLGTAGGLTKARPVLGDGDVLVWNADIFAPHDISADAKKLVAAHRSSATLLVREGSLGAGNVGWDEAFRITRLRKETVRDGECASGEFLGIHVVGRALAQIAEGCLVGDVYLPALRAGAEMHAVCTNAELYDVGSIAAYLDANAAWLRARGDSHWLGEGAVIDLGAQVLGSVVGARALIQSDALECVVWPGAVVNEPLRRIVLTDQGKKASP